MRIEYTLNLSYFNEAKLKELFKDGVITRFEYVDELNRRYVEGQENAQRLVDLLMEVRHEGKQPS